MEMLSKTLQKIRVLIKDGKGSLVELYQEFQNRKKFFKLMGLTIEGKKLDDPSVTSNVNLFKYAWYKIAISKGSLENLEYLINKGDTPDFEEPEGLTPLLHLAIDTGKLEIVEILLNYGANNVNVELKEPSELPDLKFNSPIPFKNGTTPLHRAVVTTKEDVVKLLLDRGADISKADVGKDTAMHHAAWLGNLKIVELLYNHGAPIGGIDDYCFSPLDYAIFAGHTEVFLYLLEHLSDNREFLMGIALCNAVKHERMEMTKILLDRGASVNATDKKSRNEAPLYYAVENGNFEFVKLLVNHGAKVDITSHINDTPLHASAEYNDVEITSYLLKHGADIQKRNSYGRTVLHKAAILGYTDLIEFLLDNEADFFARDRSNSTALQLALDGECMEEDEVNNTVKCLIKWMIGMQLDTSRCSEELSLLIKCDSIDQQLKIYWNDCQKEILSAKNEVIHGTSMHYYDIIELSLPRLVKYSRNENVVKAFELDRLKEKFPIFALMLHSSLQKAVERKKLCESARRVFCSICDSNDQKYPILPYFFTEEVFEYLSNKDLINLTDKFF